MRYEEIGDEVHFLNFCRSLSELRSELYREVAYLCEEETNFYMLSPENKTLLIMELSATNPSIGEYVYEMFNLRNRLLNC